MPPPWPARSQPVWQELARQLVCTVPAPPEDAGWPQELGRLAPDLATGLG